MGKGKPPSPHRAEVIKLRTEDGLTVAEIARRLNIRRTQANGIIRKLEHPEEARLGYSMRETLKVAKMPPRWDESALTEPWAAFHARKKAERMALKERPSGTAGAAPQAARA